MTLPESPPSDMHPDSVQHVNPDGELGGWVEPDAVVTEGVTLSVDAQVRDNARVFGNAQVLGAARITEDALVHGNASISGGVVMSGTGEVWA